MNKTNPNKDAETVFKAVMDLMRCSDFVFNSMRYWDDPFLKEVFWVAFSKSKTFRYFLDWLRFFAEETHEQEFFKSLFQKGFPSFTRKYTIHELFFGMTEAWKWSGGCLKDDAWCINILNKYEHKFSNYDDFIASGDFAFICCKNEKAACDLYNKAEELSKSFDEFIDLAYRIIYDLHDYRWGFELLLKASEMIENNQDAGHVMGLAYSFTEKPDTEKLYCQIQKKVLNWDRKYVNNKD